MNGIMAVFHYLSLHKSNYFKEKYKGDSSLDITGPNLHKKYITKNIDSLLTSVYSIT